MTNVCFITLDFIKTMLKIFRKRLRMMIFVAARCPGIKKGTSNRSFFAM